jgi:hypothetical protein
MTGGIGATNLSCCRRGHYLGVVQPSSKVKLSPVSVSEVRSRHTVRWFAGIGIAVSVAVLVVLVLFGIAFDQFINGFTVLASPSRAHLKPIPIAATACPYVRVLHDIANDVQRNEPLPVLMSTASIRWLAWPSPSPARAQQFREALLALDLGITVSIPRLPPVVRIYLTATQRAARLGRDQIAHTYYGFLPAQPSTNLLSSGQQSFGYASDLVGSQCGVSLQADTNTMPDLPFLVLPSPTTPHPTPTRPRGAAPSPN